MKKSVLLISLLVLYYISSFTQEMDEKYVKLNDSMQINDIKIDNAINIKLLCNDSVDIYGNKYSAEKYKIICKKKIPTMYTRTEQKHYRKGTFEYELFILEDNFLTIRDTLINEIHRYLENPKGLVTKNIYLKDGDYLLYINSGDNDYGGYLLYWYRNKVYKIVLTKSKYLFRRNIGGLYNLDINFIIASSNSIFFPFDKQGKEAYEIVKRKYLKQQ